jgi:uncharacterized protein YqhQ
MAADNDLEVLARADRSGRLPRLGGMARPNGVVIVSERFWAFATTSGEVHEGSVPASRRRIDRIPLVRGLAQLAGSLRPLVSGTGVAGKGERVFLLAALVVPLLFFPRVPDPLQLPVVVALMGLLVAWLMRGRTLRLHGAEHRAIASTEQRRLVAAWQGSARPSRFAPRCGTNFAVLALPVTVLFDRLWPVAAAPALTGAFVAVLSLAATMELWKAVQHPSGLLRGLLLPGLALQRLTTREPALDDTRIALRATASVLRRELASRTAPTLPTRRLDFRSCPLSSVGRAPPW